MKTPTGPEKIIENQILTYLWYKKIYAWKNQSVGVFDAKRNAFRKPNSQFHIKGVSDILGIYQDRFLAIEVKSKVGKVSDEQKAFIEQINSRGGKAFIARSVEDVERELFKPTE